MYPGITDYRENYVLPTAKQNGRIHLGLGCYLHTDDAARDIRSLNNATAQFWSILTALAINRLHKLIDDAGLQNDIQVTSTIYDSIFFEVTKDASIIKWLNDHIIPIMTQDFIVSQTVPNMATLEVGTSWANYGTNPLPIQASLEEVQSVLDNLE